MNLFPILPDVGGIDNVHSLSNAVFQPKKGANGSEPPDRLREIVDWDIDTDGTLTTRKPYAEIRPLANGQGGWELGGRIFVQDSGILYEGEDSPSAKVTGLLGRAAICLHGDNVVYGTDGSTHFAIDSSGLVHNWGLPVPTISISSASGTLGAGRYLVQASWSDAQGNEGGVSSLEAITLTGSTGGIRVSATPPASATAINIYASEANQKHTSFVARTSSLPYTITSIPSVADPPMTELMTGPWSGLVGVTTFRSFLLGWRDNVVVHSEAQEPHLFHPDSIWQFEGNVVAVEALDDGVWVATDKGLWWVGGQDVVDMIPLQKSWQSCRAGSKQLPGGKIPKLQTDSKVALFVCGDWLVAGHSNGTLSPLTDGFYRFPEGARLSFAFTEANPFPQLHIAVVD